MNAVGIILAGGTNDKLKALTETRATSAMPVGSCYRAIDFSLSNMTNSGIKKVAVITQYNSRSLHDHLSTSKWWDFGSKQGGLFIFTPFLSKDGNSRFRGTADSIYQNISFLKRSKEKYALITSGDGIYKMDYKNILDAHIAKKADITLVCKDMGGMDVKSFGVVKFDDTGKLLEFEEKPLRPFSSTISLGIYLMKRELLIELLETLVPEGRYSFVHDIVVRYRKELNIYGRMYNGYWAAINSIESYYNINMDFLRRDVRNKLFLHEPYIETKSKDEPPAKYNLGSRVKNCLVGSGTIIDGLAECSVLFRRVELHKDSRVRNSIIMEGCVIEEGAIVENAILDKDVRVTKNERVSGKPNDPKIVNKGTTI